MSVTADSTRWSRTKYNPWDFCNKLILIEWHFYFNLNTIYLTVNWCSSINSIISLSMDCFVIFVFHDSNEFASSPFLGTSWPNFENREPRICTCAFKMENTPNCMALRPTNELAQYTIPKNWEKYVIQKVSGDSWSRPTLISINNFFLNHLLENIYLLYLIYQGTKMSVTGLSLIRSKIGVIVHPEITKNGIELLNIVSAIGSRTHSYIMLYV